MDQLDGAAVRAWAAAAVDGLTSSAARIDAVNVFPVPDADTGTNVRLTVAGGAAAAARATDADAAGAAAAFARGCLRAARGSSGVIISQYLAGFAAALAARAAAPHGDEERAADRPATVLAHALARAAADSERAVAQPQEGTVLTVGRLVGEHARRAARAGAPLSGLLGPVLEHARADLRRVSARNPALRAAGVVDAGACALLVLLDALDRTLAAPAGRSAAPAGIAEWLPSGGPAAPAATAHAPVGGMFEVMLLVRPAHPDPEVGPRLRAALAEVGDSVAVVGADDLWHLHVHTDAPGAAIAAAGPVGLREQVVVRLVEGAAAQVAAGDDLGVVIGTDAPAMAAWFATGGSVVVVQCPEAPADAGHLVRAAADTGADHVVVLPGTPQMLGPALSLAAPDRAGSQLPGVQVEVVDAATDVLTTAVAALAVLGNHGGDAVGRADQARAALDRLRTLEVGGADRVGALEQLLDGVDRLVAGAPPAQVLTVQHADPIEDAVAVLTGLTARHPELDAVLVGPVGAGPAWRIGVD